MTEQQAGTGERHEDPDVARAEALLDRWAGRVTAFAQRAVARTREEAEDLWAEAKHVRDGMGGPSEHP